MEGGVGLPAESAHGACSLLLPKWAFRGMTMPAFSLAYCTSSFPIRACDAVTILRSRSPFKADLIVFFRAQHSVPRS